MKRSILWKKNGKLYARFKVLRSKRLRSAIIEDRLDEIGQIKEIIREINLNADRKILWLGQLKAVDNEFNDSAPISLNHFTKNQI